jgi:hypothetical protein
MPKRNAISYAASSLIVVLSCVMFFWTYRTGVELGMADALSKESAARAHYAIATALSRLGYGAPGYIIYAPVRQLYEIGAGLNVPPPQNPDITRGIQYALSQELILDCVAKPQTCQDDWGDDKGYSDYMMGAFLVFGFDVQALYKFYFLLLGISLVAFMVHFFRDVGFLVFSPLFLAAHHLAVLLLPDERVTSVIHDAHFVPAAAYLAAIHVAIVLIRRDGSPLRALPFVVVQVALILLAINSRSSSKWLVVFPVAAFVLCLPWRSGLKSVLRFGLQRSYIAALVLAVPLLLSAYKSAAYDQRYTADGIPSHLFWHALYMGLSVHPDGQHQYGLRYTDGTAYLGAYKYIQKNPKIIQGVDKRVFRIPQSQQTWDNLIKYVGFARYDQVVKAMSLEFVAAHPRYVIESTLFYKPKYLVEQILWHQHIIEDFPFWVWIENAHVPLRRTPLDFLSFPAVMVVALSFAAAWVAGGQQRVTWWLGLSGLLFAFSLAPSILVAPIHYELPIVFVAFGMMVYALGPAAVALALRYRHALPVGTPGVRTVVRPEERGAEAV